MISAARKRTNRQWRQRNREAMRELSNNFYYRERDFILWKMRLGTLLMKIRAAALARGLEPFDG